MTVQQFTTVVHYSESKGIARLVLLALADGRRAMQNLCDFANADEEEVKKALDTLVNLRELHVSERGDYEITLP